MELSRANEISHGHSARPQGALTYLHDHADSKIVSNMLDSKVDAALVGALEDMEREEVAEAQFVVARVVSAA